MMLPDPCAPFMSSATMAINDCQPLNDRMAMDAQRDIVHNPLERTFHPEQVYVQPYIPYEPYPPINMWEPVKPRVRTNMWEPISETETFSLYVPREKSLLEKWYEADMKGILSKLLSP